MPRDGSGNYQLTSGNPVVTNTVISSTWANLTLSDIGAAITQSLSKDGQTTPTANLTMGNFRLISLAAGTNRTDAVNVGQVQDNTPAVLSSIAGTGDAITAATAPAIVSYATDSKFVYTPTSTNTLTNPTIAIDGLAAKTITQSNGLGLWAGALVVGTPYELLYDGTNFRVQSGQLGLLVFQGSSQTGSRNHFIDGNFDFWSNGSIYSLSGGIAQYTADVWFASAGTGGTPTATVSQASFTVGAEPAGTTTPATSFMAFTQTAAASAQNPFIAQRMESVARFEGRSATFSVWLGGGTYTITNVQVSQVFGSGGSSTVTTLYPVTWNVTSASQRFSVRIDFPSISGKTVGSGNFVQVGVILPLSSTFTTNTFQWQIEDCPPGAPSAGLPTPYEFKGFGVEKNQITRLFQRITVSGRFPASAGSQTLDVSVTHPPMRSSPATSLATAGSRTNISTATLVGATNGSRFEIVSTAAGDTFALGDTWLLDSRF